MEDDTCSICGGEGRIAGPHGRTSACPACHGSGRRSEGGALIRDVTKTKPEHYYSKQERAEAVKKPQWPSTHEGEQLATEVRESSEVTDDVKARLITEIIEYEGSHGRCTKTFMRKVRKQIRPPPAK